LRARASFARLVLQGCTSHQPGAARAGAGCACLVLSSPPWLKRMRNVLRLCLLLLLPAILLAGCSNERSVDEGDLASMAGGELKETVPVSGTVHVDGLPAEDVFIYAYPKGNVTAPVAQIQTKPDGTYCWTTYALCDGL